MILMQSDPSIVLRIRFLPLNAIMYRSSGNNSEDSFISQSLINQFICFIADIMYRLPHLIIIDLYSTYGSYSCYIGGFDEDS